MQNLGINKLMVINRKKKKSCKLKFGHCFFIGFTYSKSKVKFLFVFLIFHYINFDMTEYADEFLVSS